MAKPVGIDLGTTNSVIAVWEGGEPTVIPVLRHWVEQALEDNTRSASSPAEAS